ncbi:MAG TPA: putative nucleotidyltransferase substrate binding domain-containing protein [Terriglobia bacterium]|nr:putative nucleotidyltransferase substrate binding domain-containing protein [Terriglobia bacterium]
MRPDFAALNFEDPGKAAGNLERLEEQLAPTLLTPLASLLSQSPDPDGALNLLERYAQGAPPQVLGELARYPTALSYLIAIFGYSGYLAETLLSEPQLVVQFARDRNFTKLKSKEDLMQDFARFSTTNPDPWLAALLARFKRRNYLRIVLKDVLRLSTLGETTLELSTLADVILSDAYLFCDRELEKRYGLPQYRDVQGRIVRAGFSIVSLGKLGGNELNYNSDIDLLFLYSHDGETAGGSERESIITNKEYFVHVAHAITRTITQATSQGEVFRVDLRLRPEGEQGDLAISLNSAREYYEHRARDWELQMLIKARHSAGDAKLTRDFLRGVEEYVYRSPGDFVAVESILLSRERISKKLRESRGQAIDVKRHRGGIRDIEFLVQCLQRLHGLQDHWVRSGGTLFALRKLNDKGWLSNRDYAALTSAYEFLRKVEHRIQMEAGQQTHRLPVDLDALDRLGRRTGVEAGPQERPGDVLLRKVREAFAVVDEIYQHVIHPGDATAPGTAFELKPAPTLLPDAGRQSFASLLSFLDVQAPEVARIVREADLPERARRNTIRLLTAMASSPERFAPARAKPASLRRAIEAVGASAYLTELLVHHPEDLEILDSAELMPSDGTAGGQLDMGLETFSLPEAYAWAFEAGLDLREKMAILRRHYRARVLELGAADLAAGGSAFPMLKRWTVNAARCIASAEVIARGHERVATGTGDVPFVVLGMGRLGLSEFDLASDADLVFVAGSEAKREDLERLTHLAEKTIEVLSSYTQDGTLFPVDTRLRPRGQEGELVVSLEELASYIAGDAQAWELLTYMKAQPLAGNPQLGQAAVDRLQAAIYDRLSTFDDFEGELHQMRRRLEREVAVPSSNTKTAPGGYYDVDFAVSYTRLRRRIAALPGANMAEQIAALGVAPAISAEDAAALTECAGFLRSVDHILRLVTGKAPNGLPENEAHAETAESVAQGWSLISEGQTLAGKLHETQQQLRYVYRRLVGSE